MKRRASVQLVPEKDIHPEYEDPYSTEPEEYTPSKRIIYKPKHDIKAKTVTSSKSIEFPPIIISKPLPQESSSYLELLNSLKSASSNEKTEEFLKEINASEIITPRKILPAANNQYKLLYQLDAKLTINNIPKGKGTLELTQALNKNLTLLIFRNCIKSVLFTGALYAESIIKIKDTPCKVKNHTEKKDIEISLIQQPEVKKI